jgi:peptidoglycan/LPS O-acetylase OafA/YrhL
MGVFRLLLALAVVIDHAGGIFGFRMIPGGMAVQVFYIVSGFLISHILLTKYPDDAGGRWLFYSNRALRIFVPYWAVLAVIVIASPQGWFDHFAALNWPAALYAIGVNITIVGQDVLLWLVVQDGNFHFAFDGLGGPNNAAQFIVDAPIWTVAVELMFYALAPFLVRRHVLTLIGLLVVTQAARWVAYSHGYYNSQLDYRFFPFELGLFVLGMLSYRLYRALGRLVEMRLAIIAVAGLAVTAIFFYHFMVFRNMGNQYRYYTVVAFALPWLFHLNSRWRVDRWIGELSFPVYLVHWPLVVTFVPWLVKPILPQPWASSACVVAALVCAVALLRLVVAPVDRWRAQRAKAPALAHGDMAGQISLSPAVPAE